MAERERIDYQFSATVAVDFSIHSHRGQEIFTPVDNRREAIRYLRRAPP
jgi:hypothetical protein